MGITSVGKSTFINSAPPDRVAKVEVGKEMRRRYPPERFRGLAAMPDTEDEVFEIYQEQLREAYRSGKEFILVDGQPRMVSQIRRVMEFYPMIPREAIWLHVDDTILEERIEARFPDDPGSRELAVKRMTNDKTQLFPVIFELLRIDTPITTINHTDAFNHELFWSKR